MLTAALIAWGIAGPIIAYLVGVNRNRPAAKKELSGVEISIRRIVDRMEDYLEDKSDQIDDRMRTLFKYYIALLRGKLS